MRVNFNLPYSLCRFHCGINQSSGMRGRSGCHCCADCIKRKDRLRLMVSELYSVMSQYKPESPHDISRIPVERERYELYYVQQEEEVVVDREAYEQKQAGQQKYMPYAVKQYEENQHKFYTREEKRLFVQQILYRHQRMGQTLAEACAQVGVYLRAFQEWRDEMIKELE